MDATRPSTVDDAPRRPAFAGFVSIASHGGVLVLVALLVDPRVPGEPQLIELTPIQVVEPVARPLPWVGAPGPSVRSMANERAGVLGRRGRDAPSRALSRAAVAPDPVADPFADVVVSYEAPAGPDPGNQAGTTGSGLGAGVFGDGTGSMGDGSFGVGNVPPAPASLARPPRAKADYRSWNFRADRWFAGATVQVELTIDPQGSVRNVRLLRGVAEHIDRHATRLARRFEFHPALDDAGEPTWGLHRWEFVLQSDATTSAPGHGLPQRRW